MANISASDLKKNLENRFNCSESSKKTIIQNIEISLIKTTARIPSGYISDTSAEKIEEEIKQLEEKLNKINGKIFHIEQRYDYLEVHYSYYKGELNFNTHRTDTGRLKLDIKINLEQIEAIKSLVSQNVLKTCENQINSFQKIFAKEINQEQVKSAVNKSFIGKITDKLK
tara:strand:+ start:53 stop:562 length:510 start_codon:yes stop_codon:yes gene_type:complete